MQRAARVNLNKELNSHRSSERIHCSFNVEEDVEWYGRGAAGVLGIGVRHATFVQPVTSRSAAVTPDFSGRGVSRRALFSIVLALVVALMIPLTSTLIEMSDMSKTVSGLESGIEAAEARIVEQEKELADVSSKYDVQYLAAQRGMHAATSRDTVYLTVHGSGN